MRTLNIQLAASLAILALAATIASAQSGGGYDLTWHTIDGGGGTSTGSGFELSGTIGQPDAGVQAAGGFELVGGFWIGGASDTSPTCLGDLDGSDSVDVFDLLILLSAWGANPGHLADLDGNGAVDVFDLLILLSAWGPCP